MAFTRFNLRAFARGDDWAVQYSILDSNSSPIDITGNTYWVTLKQNSTDPDPGSAQVSVIASGAAAVNGLITVAFDSTITANLTPGNYYYDLQEVDLTGNVYTLLLGRVKVVRDVTIST